jgi:protein-tyrosine phosphatase
MGGITIVIAIPTMFLMYLYYKTKDVASPFKTYLLLHASLVGFVITICTLPFVNWTRVLGKLDTGLIPGTSYFIFWPYFLALHTHIAVKRYFNTEPRFSEVRDGLFVGAWPSRPSDIPAGRLPAVLDCTCELPRMSCSMQSPYLCVQAWDSCAPTPGDIELAVRWAMQKRAEGVPVFIHCANGIVFSPSSPHNSPFKITYTSTQHASDKSHSNYSDP